MTGPADSRGRGLRVAQAYGDHDLWHPSMGGPPGLGSHAESPESLAWPAPLRARSGGDNWGGNSHERWHPAHGEPDDPAGPERQTLAERLAPLAARVHQVDLRKNVRAGRPALRALLLIIVAVLALAALAGRLLQIQVLDRDTYSDLGERQGVVQWELASVRGAILDRNLNLLAVSDNLPTVWADPRKVTDPHGTAAALATVLEIDTEAVAQRLAGDRHFTYIARQVDPSVGQAVAELGLPGVGVRGESSRLRPNGDGFAQGLLGAVDIDQNPLGGAEKQFAEMLDGTDGREVARIAQGGMPIPNGVQLFEPANHGDDVVLTLHTQVQWVAERAITEAVRSARAAGGMAVVMQVATGDVLALAAAARDDETGEVGPVVYNPAYVDTFEPGSVAKSFTVAAVLDAGLTQPDELHRTTLSHRFADRTFDEPYLKVQRDMTTTEILAHSSNVGTIQLAERIGSVRLQRALRSFGFGSLTGPDKSEALPGESRGILRPANQWRGTDLATISFGQGIAVTAIQLAAAYNAIANDGVHVTPRLVLGSVGSDGVMHPADDPITRRVISSETASALAEMLAAVVTDGTGKRAAIDGYRVAGKTGTAQKPSPTGGYSEWQYTSSFAGFLPADRPELTVVVVLDEPVEYRAGVVAAPVFAEVSEYALRMLQVSPDA